MNLTANPTTEPCRRATAGTPSAARVVARRWYWTRPVAGSRPELVRVLGWESVDAASGAQMWCRVRFAADGARLLLNPAHIERVASEEEVSAVTGEQPTGKSVRAAVPSAAAAVAGTRAETGLRRTSPVVKFLRDLDAGSNCMEEYRAGLYAEAERMVKVRTDKAVNELAFYEIIGRDDERRVYRLRRADKPAAISPVYTVSLAELTCDCPDCMYTLDLMNEELSRVGLTQAHILCCHLIIAAEKVCAEEASAAAAVAQGDGHSPRVAGQAAPSSSPAAAAADTIATNARQTGPAEAVRRARPCDCRGTGWIRAGAHRYACRCERGAQARANGAGGGKAVAR